MLLRVECFGARLRRLRRERGVSCSELAHRVGVTEGAIRQMETGQTKMASFVVGLRLARELGVDAWYLANGEPSDAADRSIADAAGAGAAPGARTSLAARVAALEARITLLDAPRA